MISYCTLDMVFVIIIPSFCSSLQREHMVEFISSWSGNLGRIGGGVVTMVLHGGGAHSRTWCVLDVVTALSLPPQSERAQEEIKRVCE